MGDSGPPTFWHLKFRLQAVGCVPGQALNQVQSTSPSVSGPKNMSSSSGH